MSHTAHTALRVCCAPPIRTRRGRLCCAASPSSSAAASAPRALLTTRSPTQPTLGVSFWPDFFYDAGGDSTAAIVGPLLPDGRRALEFTVTPVTAVNGASTTILGVPLPPFVNIAILPRSLRGWFEPATGSCSLDFDASFALTLFGLPLPSLSIVAPLRTGASSGVQRSGVGAPYDEASGELVLAAVARVQPTGNVLLDTFLQLPADALAILPATLDFLSEEELAERSDAVGTRPPNAARGALAARLWYGIGVIAGLQFLVHALQP